MAIMMFTLYTSLSNNNKLTNLWILMKFAHVEKDSWIGSLKREEEVGGWRGQTPSHSWRGGGGIGPRHRVGPSQMKNLIREAFHQAKAQVLHLVHPGRLPHRATNHMSGRVRIKVAYDPRGDKVIVQEAQVCYWLDSPANIGFDGLPTNGVGMTSS